MSDSEHILDELRRIIGDAQCAGPASQGDIDATEAALGATLPPSFRTFLLHFGAGALPAPFTLVGLPPTRASNPFPPMWSHLLDVAAQLRRHATQPDSFIPIASDGCGINIFLDLSRTDATGECPVVARGPGVDDVDIAPTFLSFAQAAAFGDPLASL